MGVSPTIALHQRVIELQAAGKDVVSFAIGEPDFDTPRTARERAKQAIDEGHTHYTTNRGILPLRNAVRQHLATSLGVDYSEDEIVVSPGSKFDLYAGMCSVLDPGDEALVPTPVWVSTPPQIELAGGVPVLVPTREVAGFVPQRRDLEAACTERTRLIVLNSPNNPTGAVYSRETLQEIAELAIERDLVVISDEIYSGLVFGDRQHQSIAAMPGMHERTLVTWGVAKSYAMTGWRIGFAAGPREWVSAIDRLQSQMTSCPSSISQYAALQAILGAGGDTERMRQEFDERRLYVVGRLRAISGVTCAEPQGTFYAFPGVAALLGRTIEGQKIETAFDFCAALLEHAGVAATPGEAFEAPGHLRLSFAASQSTLETGLDRFEEFVGRLEE